MPATFNIPTQQVIPGQLIASALWNNEFKNIFDNFTPGGMDDYSSTSIQMQTMADPFPGSILALPLSMAGELERVRFTLAGAKGTTNWYEPPVKTNLALDNFVKSHTHTGTTDGTQIPTAGIADGAVTYPKLAAGVTMAPGTVVVFYQAAAPVGWTKLTTQNDKALRVVSGAGGGSGGTTGFSGGIAHSHVVNSHTHDLGNHIHELDRSTDINQADPNTGNPVYSRDSNSNHLFSKAASAGGFIVRNILNVTRGASPNTSDAASPGTDTVTYSPAYIDVIICSKD